MSNPGLVPTCTFSDQENDNWSYQYSLKIIFLMIQQKRQKFGNL